MHYTVTMHSLLNFLSLHMRRYVYCVRDYTDQRSVAAAEAI